MVAIGNAVVSLLILLDYLIHPGCFGFFGFRKVQPSIPFANEPYFTADRFILIRDLRWSWARGS